MGQFIEVFGVSISYIFWMLICFVEVALPLFVVALIIHLWHKSMKQNEREDISSTKERVVNSLVLVIFPPVASYEYGIGKALITLLVQFFGFIATFSLLILTHKKCGVNIDFILGIVLLIILSWGLGILCATVQKKSQQNFRISK
jgi:cytochrome b subunit of formate dehydrogenase